uniref:Phospholipase A2 receptor 1 n=1 Tax=Neolamprologus brichardi TaxID=32507 RepID=A0A3Q4HRL2_NEOBR
SRTLWFTEEFMVDSMTARCPGPVTANRGQIITPPPHCLTVVLEDCERPTRRMLWKWVSQHRLFNLGTSACLGLNISDSTQPLGMFECDVSLPVLWWRCNGNTLYGASQWRVTVIRGLVAVKKNIYHQWKRYNTPREGPCSYPYEDIHTLLGNAHGMPCAFPFKYNNQWYSECTTEGREDHLLWCSTTPRYDKGERWGFCPIRTMLDNASHLLHDVLSSHRRTFSERTKNNTGNQSCPSNPHYRVQ